MVTEESLLVLRFAATFVWADLEVVDSERRFLRALAGELEIAEDVATALLTHPPRPEQVDPGAVSPALADAIRRAALRAIAADGRVDRAEMRLFELLDDLLPKDQSE